MLSSDEIIRFVHEEAATKGVEVPPRMEEAFREQFGDLELKSPDNVYSSLCSPLRAALKLPANREFEPLFKSVSDAVRLRVGIELGFAQAVAEPSRGKPSIRSTLCRFLDQLQDGVEWSASDLKEWEGGTALYSRIYKYVPFNLKSIEIILGDSAESKLKRNPFVPERRIVLASRHDVEKYLFEFLQLQAGKEWAITDLLSWKSEDGLVTGNTLCERLRRFGPFEDSLAEICNSPRLSAALAVASFRPRQHITNIDQCREHLRGFLASLLEGEEWSPSRLQEWPGVDDGPTGSAIASWINRNVSASVDRDALNRVLGEDVSSLLARNPFTRHEKIILSLPDAKECLLAFLNTLRVGACWSPSLLDAWRSKRWIGRNLLHWIRRNIRHEGDVDWLYVLIKIVPEEILAMHPFKRYGDFVLSPSTHFDRGESTSFTTSAPEVDWGRLIARTDMNPEDELLKKEEGAIFEDLQPAILLLSADERRLIEDFYANRPVDEALFISIVGKLQKILGVL